MNQLRKTQLNLTQASILAIVFVLSFFLQEKGGLALNGLFLITALFSLQSNWLTFASFILFLLGALSKLTLCWWASYVLVLSALSFFFSLLLIARNYHWTFMLTAASSLVFLIGLLAKLEHHWYASYLILIGLSIICIAYTIRFAVKSGKNIYDITKLLLIWSIAWSKMSALEHYRIPITIAIFQMTIFLLFVILSFYDILNNRRWTSA